MRRDRSDKGQQHQKRCRRTSLSHLAEGDQPSLQQGPNTACEALANDEQAIGRRRPTSHEDTAPAQHSDLIGRHEFPCGTVDMLHKRKPSQRLLICENSDTWMNELSDIGYDEGDIFSDADGAVLSVGDADGGGDIGVGSIEIGKVVYRRTG